MKKIGITGSLASGKTTASKILSLNKGPLFSADASVRKIYKTNKFINKISARFKIGNKRNIKKILKKRITEDPSYIKKLEKIIHPYVRKEMKSFIKKNYKKKLIFLEIPLLIESKLMKWFDVIFYIKAKKSIRLKRFRSKGGNKKFFHILNNKQLNDAKKIKFCDHIISNEKNLKFLKKNLLDIIKLYE